MKSQVGTLVFFSGKMGAGKTTYSKLVTKELNAILLSEDEWLASLYPQKILSFQDYVYYSNLLKPQMKKLVQSILLSGKDVVMDFPANTPNQRAWFNEMFSEVHAPHRLIFIDVANEVCLERIEKRRHEQPERAATDTVEMFERMTAYFSPPSREEGFNIERVPSL